MGSIRRFPLWRVVLGIAVVLAASFACSEASAQGWLAGASAGVATQYDYEVGGPIANSDETDTAFRAFGGYMFMPVLGVALSYVDLGDANYDGPAFGGFTDKLGADGFDLSLIAGWAPGSQKLFSLFGTVGIFRWQQDVHYQDPSGVYPYDDSGTSLSYGIGGEFALGEGGKYGVHIDYQIFTDVGDPDNSGHQYDRSFASVGFDYRFGR
jgi:hypothetical protein